jgi:RNA polymerase sigma-70 factor (ECF subfamily)
VTALAPKPATGTAAGRRYDDVDLERDRALVERAQGGDRAAFDELYRRYHQRLLRFCRTRVGDPDEAEDIVQEAFARAWRALPRFGGERRFYPWLSVIAGHLCSDASRRRSRTTPVDDLGEHLAPSSDASGEDLLVAAADAALATQAFARLNPRHQRILYLREEAGWSYQKIAEHEEIALVAVQTLLWRARQALRREFAAIAEGSGALAGVLAGVAWLRRLLVGLGRSARHGASAALSGGWATAAAIGTVATVATGITLGVVGQPTTPHHTVAVGIASSADDTTPVRVAPPGATTRSGTGHAGATARPTVPATAGRSPVASAPEDHAGHTGDTVAPTSSTATTPSDPGTATVGGGLTQTLRGVAGTVSGVTGLLGLSKDSSSGLGAVTAPLGSTVSGLGVTVLGLGDTLGGVTGSLGSTVSGIGAALPSPLSALSALTAPVGSTLHTLPSDTTSTADGLLGAAGGTVEDLGNATGTGSGSGSSGTSASTSTSAASSALGTAASGVAGVSCDVTSTTQGLLSAVGGLLGTSSSSGSSSSGSSSSC